MKRPCQAIALAGALHFNIPLPAFSQVAFTGYSGSISTPTPDVLHEGSVALSFSWIDGPETYLRSPLTNRIYTITAGVLPNLEVTMRLTEMVGWHDATVPGVTYGNDRMFSAKYHIPILSTMPKFSIGIQDIASANLLAGIVQNDPRELYGHSMLYGVAGDSFGPCSWYIGVATSREFINGFFGGLIIDTFPGIQLIGEHDSRHFNWGARINPSPLIDLKICNLGANTLGVSSTLAFQL